MPRHPGDHRIDDQGIQSSVRPWVPFWSEVPNCPIESGMRTKDNRLSTGIAMVEWLKLGAVSLLLSMLIAAMAGIYYRVP